MRQVFLLVVILVLTATFAFSEERAISVDHIDGLWTDVNGSVGPAGTSYLNPGAVTYYLRYTNDSDTYVPGMTNGFVVYGPESFYPASGAELAFTNNGRLRYLSDLYSLVAVVDTFSSDGSGADTVAFSYSGMMEIGLWEGFDEVVSAIYTGCDAEGETLCLDSTFYPPSGFWLWAVAGIGIITPGWDGPHCYEVKVCCTRRGDIDFDGSTATISDVVYLVQYMFQNGPPPPCLENANWDGSGDTPDITDLVGMVSFMFMGGEPAAPCQ
ncbi:MAG TPA: hypothetical protein PLF13_08510 [candidate division Zixibacteria bacterium]|nr:hypothetical protein [candidate division Zixibacteria bacterium]